MKKNSTTTTAQSTGEKRAAQQKRRQDRKAQRINDVAKPKEPRLYRLHHVAGSHLRNDERLIIERVWSKNLRKDGTLIRSIRTIAKQLGLAFETLRRELRKGFLYSPQRIGNTIRYSDYSAALAQGKTTEALSQRGPRQVVSNRLKEALRCEMNSKGTVSPETALYRLKKANELLPQERRIRLCSVRTLYCHIHLGDIGMDSAWLPTGSFHPRRNGGGTKLAIHHIPGTSIDDMAEELLKRENFGTWEMDTVVSCREGSDGILVLIERTTRYYLMIKIKAISQRCVLRALRQLIKRNKMPVIHAVLTDNGCEFLDHARLTKVFKANVYYTHAYASWQKGSVENANGRLRKWFPKGTDFSLVSHAEIAAVNANINAIYRRKSLGGTTAEEAYSAILAAS